MGIFSSDEHDSYYILYHQVKEELERLKLSKIAETYITQSSLEAKLRPILDIVNDQIGCSDVGYFIQESEARNALEQADTAFNEIDNLLREILGE